MGSETILIVTGMHRSGTSLLARFVHHSGIDLGDQLLGAKRSNIHGHYEDIEFLDFHRSILMREFGHQMWVPRPPALSEQDRRVALGLIAARSHKPHWGWKDPRTCLFLDFWSDLLPDARFLFVVRHPDLVLDSLSRRTKTRFYHLGLHNTFLSSWLLYNQECLSFREANPRRTVLVMLDRLLTTPEALVDVLGERLGFTLDAAMFHSLYDSRVLALGSRRRLVVSSALRQQCLSLYRKLGENADG
jgi:hypothetical protein